MTSHSEASRAKTYMRRLTPHILCLCYFKVFTVLSLEAFGNDRDANAALQTQQSDVAADPWLTYLNTPVV